ncbi:hypothetical protein DFJ77DRAFT_474430 [Powellomyces hirtus]|nr:hypothetical protein DFJ77DRAFT_474430 [Powellomyces hirtus]
MLRTSYNSRQWGSAVDAAAPQPQWTDHTSSSSSTSASTFFSAERHHARLAAGSTTSPPGLLSPSTPLSSHPTASEALVFSTMVAESTDEVMMEARALLTHWMSQAADLNETETENDSGRGGGHDDASVHIRARLLKRDLEDEDLEMRLCAATQRGEVRDIVADAIDMGCQKSSHLDKSHGSADPRVSMRARQVLARERRESARRVLAEELARKMAAKQVKAVEGLAGRARTRTAPASKMECAVRAARDLIETELARKREVRLGNAQRGARSVRASLVDEEYARLRTANHSNAVTPAPATHLDSTLPPSINPRTTSPDNAPSTPLPPPAAISRLEEVSSHICAATREEESRREDETRRAAAADAQVERIAEIKRSRLEVGRARAETLFVLWRRKILKAHIAAWFRLVCEQREAATRFQVPRQWRTLNQAWQSWCRARRGRESERIAAEESRRLQHIRTTTLRATRFRRARVLSRVFVAWTAWVETERESRRTRVQHEERAARMKQVLAKLALKARQEAEAEERRLKEVEKQAAKVKTKNQAAAAAATPAVAEVVGVPNEPNVVPGEEQEKEAEEEKGEGAIKVPAPLLAVPPRPPANGRSKSRGPVRTARDLKLISEMEQRQKERQARRAALQEAKASAAAAAAESAARMEQQQQAAAAAEKERLRAERLALEAAHEAARTARAERVGRVQAFRAKWMLRGAVRAWKRVVDGDVGRAKVVWMGRWVRVWRKEWEGRCAERERKAGDMWMRNTVGWVWSVWRHTCANHQARHVAACLHHTQGSQRDWMREWRDRYGHASHRRIAREAANAARADALAQRLVPKRFMRRWRAYVANEKEQKWREYRKQVLRERVKEILHDSPFEAKLAVETITGQEWLEEEGIGCAAAE